MCSFELTPVPPGDTPVVATRRFAFSRPSPGVGTLQMKTCSYKETRIELFGLRDPDAEILLNGQRLGVVAGPVIDKATEGEVEKCDVGIEVELNQKLVTSFRELATIEVGGYLQEQDDPAEPP